MLSRVAESLYWTGRYIERAEDTSRLLHVNFHGLLDADLPSRGHAWRELIQLLGREFPAEADRVAPFRGMTGGQG